MAKSELASALAKVDWNRNTRKFLSDKICVKQIEASNMRLALWARELEETDRKNPALCFIREMQVSGYNVAALCALGLYKAGAACIRTTFETALYYSYFRTHPTELATLVRDSNYHIDRMTIFDFHRKHTPQFGPSQEKLGLSTRADEWYKFVSGIIHGKVPGSWVEHVALVDIQYVKSTSEVVSKTFEDGVDLVHRLFLCTVASELWSDFSTSVKKKLIAGLSGDVKTTLRLDAA